MIKEEARKVKVAKSHSNMEGSLADCRERIQPKRKRQNRRKRKKREEEKEMRKGREGRERTIVCKVGIRAMFEEKGDT